MKGRVKRAVRVQAQKIGAGVEISAHQNLPVGLECEAVNMAKAEDHGAESVVRGAVRVEATNAAGWLSAQVAEVPSDENLPVRLHR